MLRAMNIEKLTKEDWEWLVTKTQIWPSFGIDNVDYVVNEEGHITTTMRSFEEMAKELSQKAYGGKFIHSPSMIENKEQKGRRGYLIFGDIPEEPLIVWRD